MSFVVFTIEYALRLYVAVEHEPYKHLSPLRARWRYATSPAGLIDLIAILPFWFAFVAPEETRLVLVLRVFRFLKIARYSRSMQSLLDTIYDERRALGGCVLIVAGFTIISATLMHAVEGSVQPDKFGTIPDAMWWAIVTLGTIGYGDVVPVTAAGKVIAAITIFAAIVTIALPVGIIATAFAEQVHRRDFIVTWGMVSRVPLFAGLTAGEIADVMRLLRAETREAGTVIARRGDDAHSMYFIARGEVEIELARRQPQARRGTFLRRDGGVAPGSAYRDGPGAGTHQPAGARCARPACADATAAHHRAAAAGNHEGSDRRRARDPRRRSADRRVAGGCRHSDCPAEKAAQPSQDLIPLR